jgi:transposase InsO family protein
VPEDTGVEETSDLDTPGESTTSPTTPQSKTAKKRRKKKVGEKWSELDYERAKDDKHMQKSVELHARGEKFTSRKSAIPHKGEEAHVYSFVYTDNIHMFTETLETDNESGYESSQEDDSGPTYEDQLKQSWQSLHTGRCALYTPDRTRGNMRNTQEILADLTATAPQEIPDTDSCEGKDNDDRYDMDRGPTPRPLVQMSEITTITDLLHVGIKEVDRPERTVAPMIFNGTINGIPCTMMYDTGAGTSVICPNFAQQNNIDCVQSTSPIRLRYGSGQVVGTHMETRQTNLSVGEVKFKDTFYLNPAPLKVVDVILGLSFITRERTEQRFHESTQQDKKPFVQFPNGAKMYTRDDIMGSTTVDCGLVTLEEASTFLKQEQKRNGSLRDIESYVVSVTKEMQLTGDIAATAAQEKAIHPDIQKLMDKRQNIFRTEVPIGEIMDREIKMTHKIPIKQGEEPVKIRPIPISGPKLAVLQALIQNLLEAGVIEKGNLNSEWGSPVLLLRKGGTRAGLTNSWRIVCDFRQLNAKSQKLTWTPPNVREILDDLQGHKYFSKTDAVGGFYQLELDKEDREKTTFRIKTPGGGMEAYRFRVSCLGLQGCPHSYQNFMEKVVQGLKDTYVYLDDVIIASRTWTEHLQQLDEYFARCEQHKVFLHPLKCEFGVEEIEYLGLKVSKNRLQISDDKIAAVRAYNTPDSYPALHRFLGFVNYLSCFIPNHAEKTAPMSDLLQGGEKKKKFTWNHSCERSFQQIKQDLISAVGLGIPDKDGDLVVETDASGVACGAVLYQFTGGRLVPLWYLSKKLNKHEKNYSARDREALSVCWALTKLQSYLHLKPFVLYSDHQSLIYLKTQKEIKTSRDYRWMEIISQYDFEQRYRKGELMTVPDALSRAFDNRADSKGVWKDMEHQCRTEIEPLVGVLNAKGEEDTLLNMVQTENAFIQGTDITMMVNDQIGNLFSEHIPNTGTKQQRKDKEKLHEEYIYPCIATKIFGDLGTSLQKAYPEDPHFREIFEAIQKPLKDMSDKEKTLCRNFSYHDGYLLYNKEGVLGQGRICVPRTEGNGIRLTVLYEAHEAVLHGGMDKTYTRISNHYWWPSMHKDCKNYVRSCNACRRFASIQARPGGAKETHEIPEGRFETICADFITDLPKTNRGYDTILAVHDKVTKYAYLIPACKNDTAEETAERMFAHVFSQHGLPRCLMSDRDHLFTASFFAQLMRIVDVKQKMGTSYHHDYNGAAERLNRTVEVMLRHVVGDYPDRDFDTHLPLIQWAYNTSLHKSIGTTPFYALYGHEPKQPLDLPNIADRERARNEHLGIEGFVTHQQDVLKQVRDALISAQITMDEHANKNARNAADLLVGDKVYLSTRNLGRTHLKSGVDKLQEKFIGPFEILEKKSRYTYKLKLPKKMSRLHPIFHVSLLWKEIERAEDLRAPEQNVGQAEYAPAPQLPQGGNGNDQQVNPDQPSEQNGEPNTLPNAPATHDAEGDHLITDDGDQLYEVENIVKRRKVGKTRAYEYLVKWRGYPDTENTWLKHSFFVGADARKMRTDFDKAQEDK